MFINTRKKKGKGEVALKKKGMNVWAWETERDKTERKCEMRQSTQNMQFLCMSVSEGIGGKRKRIVSCLCAS